MPSATERRSPRRGSGSGTRSTTPNRSYGSTRCEFSPGRRSREVNQAPRRFAVLTFLGANRTYRNGISRRDVLRVGALGVAGLTLPDVLRLQAAAPSSPGAGRGKSVIMIWLRGGASHIDSYDMKP